MIVWENRCGKVVVCLAYAVQAKTRWDIIAYSHNNVLFSTTQPSIHLGAWSMTKMQQTDCLVSYIHTCMIMLLYAHLVSYYIRI